MPSPQAWTPLGFGFPFGELVARTLIAATAGSIGCRSSPPSTLDFTAIDSAGVAITNSRAPSWTASEAWTIDSTPLLDIGSADGEEPFMLNGAESAWRTPDGGVFFANAGTQEIRFFDSTGGFVKSVGRRGGGPGEFSQFSFMMITPAGSELLVADEFSSRVNVFGWDGRFLRTVRLAIPAGRARPNLVGAVGADWVVGSAAGRFDQKPGKWIRDTVQYSRYRPDGGRVASIVSVPTQPSWAFGTAPDRLAFMTIPMTVEPAIMVDSSSFLVRATDRGEIERWSLDGALLGRHRWGLGERRPVSAVVDRQWKAWLGQSDSALRAFFEAFRRSDPILPEFVPTHSRLASGPDGTVWVQHYYLDWEPDRRWDVLDRSGRWLGTVAMPARHWLYRAGEDHVLAWHRDSLDVEHVTIHRLRRPVGRTQRP